MNPRPTRRLGPALLRGATLAIIYLGLPLLGWGVWAMPGFFAHATRVAYALVVAAQALFGAWLMFTFAPPPPPAALPSADPPPLMARWHAYLFETIAVLAAYGDPRGVLVMQENEAARWLGLGLYVAGAALMNWALYTQARHLPALPKPVPELLASGPYRRVRHPQHLAVFFYCLGFALLFRSWIGLALMAAQAAALVHRIKNEEQELARRHGALWTERVRTSWKLVPYVY